MPASISTTLKPLCTGLRGAIVDGALRAVAPPGKPVAFAGKVVEVDDIERDATPPCPAASAAPR